MKMILKSALAAAALAGAATLIPAAATACVAVTLGVGVPGAAVYVSPYGVGYLPYDDDYYYDPVYISGAWYHGPYRWQMRHGERMFFVNGRWHRNEWRGGAMPNTIMFRNGGSFRDGRNNGFSSAERINARFRSNDADVHSDRRELKDDRKEMRDDHRDLRDDKRDDRQDAKQGDHSRN
jgi:hypothetical protein